MSHGKLCDIDVDEVIDAPPFSASSKLCITLWCLVGLGGITFFIGLGTLSPEHVWGAYYVNVLFWMGLGFGAAMPAVIFQIVRAEWSPPVRRISEASIAFLPWGILLLLLTYFGKKHLFYWANHPMPGRETWMQPEFVYVRFAVLLPFLAYLMYRFVMLSLRGDIGLLRERASDKNRWTGWLYYTLVKNWQGTHKEVGELQRSMSCSAPVIVIFYALIYTLFVTEMVVGMDPIWFSNMYGGFTFCGNIYIGWVSITLIALLLCKHSADYAKTMSTQQLWDLGKLTFGFCMLWGYMFFAQYLPQWYGNLPEETQWLIMRTRDYPWKYAGYVVFAMCFVMPFILLLSEDIKKTPKALSMVGVMILLGVWGEKYVTVMPQVSPKEIPFGLLEIGLFLGFLGAYGLSIQGFLKRFPFVPVSHPLTKGDVDW